ncbi:hypothetical protein GQ53DRAFT_661759 [Thozetella sp. PMI_491]|nr:hypothetical protein GQ53DRAFT_661759 [Thozetella sp. PMI_491]
MDYVDFYQRPYSRVNIPAAYHAQPHPAPQGPQLALWTNQQLMALYHQQRNAVMMAQGNLHIAKQTEPKPRLTKDEVDFLEGEFAKNPKPTSSTKREIAEQMRVEVARINNWFQNRRAKEKQLKRHREMEAMNRDASKSSDEQDQDEADGSENQAIGPSTAPFGEADEEHDDEFTEEQDGMADSDYQDPTSAMGTEHVHHALPVVSEDDDLAHVEYPTAASPAQHDSASDLPETAGDEFQSAQQPFSFMVTQAPLSAGIAASGLDALTSQPELLGGSNMYTPFPSADYFALPQTPFASAPQQSLEVESPSQMQSPDHIKMEQLSPSSIPESPQLPEDARFKSPPPPTDIASRRNMRRPAPLVGLASLRTVHGPKTGIDIPRRTEGPTPMRRISSASGYGPNRIQKSFSSGPRSPFNLERNKEALYQSLNSSQSPVLNTLNSAFSPIAADNQCLRENTASSSASEEEHGYTFGSLGATFYKPEQTIKTPPSTPGLRLNLQDNMFATPSDPWNYLPQDEPLTTPSLCSHGSEVEFSMAPQLPAYVSSQPVTPSFPNIGPAYNQFYGQSLPNTEYTFPDSYPTDPSVRSSPGQPAKARTQFQFAQNITPQDFNAEK